VRHYATVCKREQLPVLLASMHQHCDDFALHVLAWDYETVGNWGSYIHITTRADFIARHPDFEPSRLPGPPRSPVDTVATVRWQFFADVMAEIGQPLTTLDGDVWFFSSPEPVFAEIGRAPMAVCPHRIPPAARGLPGVTYETHWIYGEFNSGITYWADPAPLAEMAALTREWSYTEVRRHPVDGRPDFGDQGALERVARRHGAHVIAHEGFNVAPWNLHNQRLAKAVYDNAVYFGPEPVVGFHFSSLRLAPDGSAAQLANADYEVERAPGAVELIYEPYLAAMRKDRHG